MDSYKWMCTVGRSGKAYIHQLCADTGCSLDDLPGVMDNRDRWQEKVRELCAINTT